MNNAVTDERRKQESMGVRTLRCANSGDLDADLGHEIGLEDRRPKRPAMIAVDVWESDDELETELKSEA